MKKENDKNTVQKRRGTELTSHNFQQERERTNTHGVGLRVIKVKNKVK
jgi:hypothetical protein